MRPIPSSLSMLPCFGLVLLAACGSAGREPATPAELARALAAAERIEIYLPRVVEGPASEEAAAPSGRRALRARIELAARTLAERRGVEVRLVEEPQAGDERAPRVVLGAPEDPLVRGLILAAEGRDLGEGGLAWNGCVLQARGDVLLACFEDPERAGLPVTLFVARELSDLAFVCDDLTPRARPTLRFLRRDRAVLDLALTADGRARLGSGRALEWGEWSDVRRTRSYRMRRAPAVDEELARAYADEVDAALARLDAWSATPARGFQGLYLVASGEAQRAWTGSSDQFVPAGSLGRSFVRIAAGLADDSGAGPAREAARAALGEPAEAWMLVGAGLDAADAWWEAPLRDWGRRLVELELLPEASEIMRAGAIDVHSQHILAPARGLLWRYLRETRGAAQLRAVWRGEARAEVADAEFRGWLGAHRGGLESLAPSARAAHLARLDELGFWRGVAFASNARAGGGYDGVELGRSLRGAVAHSVNALCVTSFYAERRPVPSAVGGQLPPGRQSLEGDLALAQVFAAARAHGIERVALRPQLLLSESAGYSNWLRRTELDHWREFYASYEAFATHYALLAELCGVDLLALGTELAAPQSREGLSAEVREFRREALGRVIARTRASFGGALSYAASWPAEARGFEHWQALDYVGISWFPRAGERGATPRDERTLTRDWRSQLANVATVAEEAGKPWLVLEFGVRATTGGTGDTRLGPGAPDPAQQARGVRALAAALEGLAGRGKAPAGLFWWHWNASPKAAGAGARGYSLQDQPGRAALFELGRGL